MGVKCKAEKSVYTQSISVEKNSGIHLNTMLRTCTNNKEKIMSYSVMDRNSKL